MTITTLIGTAGALILLVFFVLEQLHKINNRDWRYDLGNFIGSSLLVAYAHLLSSVPFAVLNMIWALVSLRDLLARGKSIRRK